MIVLRLVIIDRSKNGEMPEVHRHDYLYRGFEATDRTMKTAVLEHEEAYCYDGAGIKVVESVRGKDPHWFCVPNAAEDL